MKEPIHYYQPDNMGAINLRGSPNFTPDYEWRVPKWDMLDELVNYLLLAGCEVAGDPRTENFIVYSFLSPSDAVVHCERSEYGDNDPAIDIVVLHALYDHFNCGQQEAISDEP